jgi:hypothetical protein
LDPILFAEAKSSLGDDAKKFRRAPAGHSALCSR